MVEHIKRDKNDIYGWPVIGFMFKNPTFLLLLKLTVLGLFFYGIYYGFADQSNGNLFTDALFWGLFWPLFMVVSLGTLGRVFCGICPHGFMGKYLTKWGLKKKMPKALQNPMIGVMLLVIGWWAVYYAYPGFFKSPFATAMLFLVMTLVAAVFYLLFADMGYCKSVCPIGAVSRGFSKVSFTWLGTYKASCSDCRTFECASACPHNLKPFTFDSRNSMTDCTLCMDCSSACEAVSFKVKKPSASLFKKFQNYKAEVWAFILIAGSITITMNFHHALGRSAIVEEFPWTQTARYFEGIFNFGMADSVGIFAFLYAVAITLFLTTCGMYIASKIMKTPYSQTFYTLGYAFAPIFIIGGLSHLLHSFFLHTASDITNGFIQAFALPFDAMEPLATRKDKWLYIFGAFNYIAAIWAFVIMFGRIRLMERKTTLKVIAFPFAAAFIIFYLWLNFYKGYVFKTYGMNRGGHAHHGQSKEQLFQSVSPNKAVLLQEGAGKNAGANCGMDLTRFYKTNHAATLNGATKQYCSMHCLAEALYIKQLPLEKIRVVAVDTLQFVDANSAFYVVGSRKAGTMTKTGKYAFADKAAAIQFAQENGGTIMNFQTAMERALR